MIDTGSFHCGGNPLKCRGIFLTAIWFVYKYQGLDIKSILDIQKDPHQYSAGTATEASSGFGAGN